jgi:hypothetical protein
LASAGGASRAGELALRSRLGSCELRSLRSSATRVFLSTCLTAGALKMRGAWHVHHGQSAASAESFMERTSSKMPWSRHSYS